MKNDGEAKGELWSSKVASGFVWRQAPEKWIHNYPEEADMVQTGVI